MDSIVAMGSIFTVLQNRGIALVISSLEPRMILKLRRAGIRKRPGKVAFTRNLDDSFEASRKMIEQKHERRQLPA